VRDELVEPGGIVEDAKGRVWRVLAVDDEKITLRKLRGRKRIEVSWEEWAQGCWELRFP